MTVRVGVVGCGSVFWTPYMTLIERLAREGRVAVTAVYDADPAKREAAARRLDLTPDVASDVAVCEHDDVDAVLVLTSMPEHARLARAALEAGKHVLVEKPMATDLRAGAALLEAAEAAPGVLVCAPHILLSPTYRAMHARASAGEIGGLLSARARYGWAGPWWGRWYYEPGGGALFDLGIYNVTSLCGFFGPARRVTAMTGVAIPERIIDGERVRVRAEDNAHVLIDFGDARFAVVTTGFTMQRYRSPCIELYGTHGEMQMLGDDWAPEGLYFVGPLVDVGIYPLTILTAMFGPVRRVTAYATTIQPERVRKDGTPFTLETPDFWVANLELDDLVVRLTSTFWVPASKQRGLELHGEDGSLWMPTWAEFNSRLMHTTNGEDYEQLPYLREPFAGIDWARALVDLAEALRDDRPHRMTGWHAAHVVEVLNGAERSARDGGPVDVKSTFEPPSPLEWAS
jgi:predicted dehydrogenase